MLLSSSVFTPVYEVLIGANPLNPEYRDGVFASVGLVSILSSLIICAVFYVALGRWKPVFHKVVHWMITLSICAIIGFSIAYVLTGNEIGTVDGYAMRFAFINSFYAMIYFSVLSILFKRFSIFAKHTPF